MSKRSAMVADALAVDEPESLSATWASMAQTVAQETVVAQAWHTMNQRWRRQK